MLDLGRAFLLSNRLMHAGTLDKEKVSRMTRTPPIVNQTPNYQILFKYSPYIRLGWIEAWFLKVRREGTIEYCTIIFISIVPMHYIQQFSTLMCTRAIFMQENTNTILSLLYR